MLNHVGMAKETVDQILPRLDDLLQINGNKMSLVNLTHKMFHHRFYLFWYVLDIGDFLNRLKASESEDSVVNSIGDVLEQQVRDDSTFSSDY